MTKHHDHTDGKATTDPLALNRIAYLETVRDICTTLSMIRAVSSLACPVLGDPEPGDIKRLAELKRDLARHVGEMKSIEKDAEHGIGVVRLLGFEPHIALRLAVAALTASALTSDLWYETSTVACLASFVSGDDVEGLLSVHMALQSGGVLGGHVGFSIPRKGVTGALRSPCLTDSSLNMLLGMGSKPDDGGES